MYVSSFHERKFRHYRKRKFYIFITVNTEVVTCYFNDNLIADDCISKMVKREDNTSH